MPAPTPIATRTARVRLRPDGIVQVSILPSLVQSEADAEANIAAAIEVSTRVRRPIMVDISQSPPLPPQTRRLYSGRVLIESFSALGLVVQANPVGRMLGNVYFRIARPGIPISLFEGEEPAVSWLKAHL
jgi:hypothetical protein